MTIDVETRRQILQRIRDIIAPVYGTAHIPIPPDESLLKTRIGLGFIIGRVWASGVGDKLEPHHAEFIIDVLTQSTNDELLEVFPR